MKVLYISLHGGIFTRAGKGGGSHLVSAETAKQMAKRGHQVLYLCNGKKNKLTEYSQNLKMVEVESAPFEMEFPVFTPGNKKFIFETIEDFNPDICHAQNMSPLGLLVQKWTMEKKIPFVTTLHVLPSDVLDFGLNEFLPIDESDYLYQKFKDVSAKALHKEYLERCTMVIALNQAIQKDIQKYIPAEKVVIIPNGIDLAKFGKITPYKGNEKNLLFSGSLIKRKNQEFLIQMHSNLPNDIKLTLVGKPFTQGYLDKLHELVEKSANKNIEFTGHVQTSQIPKYLDKTKVFVSASKKEVQSLSVIEALASAKPIVALENETTIELVNDNVGKLLPQDVDPAIFSQEVKKILNLSDKDYYEMCIRCKQSVEKFSWDNVCNQLTSFYKKTVADNPVQSDITTDQVKPKQQFTNLFIYSLASVLIFKTYISLKNLLQDEDEEEQLV